MTHNKIDTLYSGFDYKLFLRNIISDNNLYSNEVTFDDKEIEIINIMINRYPHNTLKHITLDMSDKDYYSAYRRGLLDEIPDILINKLINEGKDTWLDNFKWLMSDIRHLEYLDNVIKSKDINGLNLSALISHAMLDYFIDITDNSIIKIHKCYVDFYNQVNHEVNETPCEYQMKLHDVKKLEYK